VTALLAALGSAWAGAAGDERRRCGHRAGWQVATIDVATEARGT
jgi:hypothetical protein